MKLFKKLLPIATIASATAVVLPIATSCASTLVPFVYTEQQIMDDDWKPEAPQRHVSITPDMATYEYLKDVGKNRRIFADDLMFYIKNSFERKSELKKIHVGVGNVIPDSNKISFSINLEFKTTPVFSKDTFISMSCFNFPIMVHQQTTEGGGKHWGFEPLAFYLFPELDDPNYRQERAIFMLGVKGWSLHLKYQNAAGDLIQWDVSPSDIVLVIENVLEFCKGFITFSPTSTAYLYHFDPVNP